MPTRCVVRKVDPRPLVENHASFTVDEVRIQFTRRPIGGHLRERLPA